MGISVNSSMSGVSSESQYSAKISQLEVLMRAYQAQLQTESDLDKQKEIKEKIQEIQTQISNYQTKAANSVTGDGLSEVANTYNNKEEKPQVIVEISNEGKTLYEKMKLWNKKQEIQEDENKRIEEKVN